MVEAWDGWCNYGIADRRRANIKFVVPKEGSDLWADTMVVLKTSKNKEAAHALHQLHPRPRGALLGRREHPTTRCPTRRPWTRSTRPW